MEKSRVSIHPSLEVIPEIEQNAHSSQRTHYNNNHNRHVQLPHPSLEVISEIEPNAHSSRRTHYNNNHNRHVQLPEEIIYEKPVNHSSSPIRDGHVNQGYSGNSLNGIHREDSTPSVNGVYREQYWICSQPLRCRNWTKRERILFYVLLGLSSAVLGLIALVSFISQDKNGDSTPQGWFPWL